MAAHALMPGLAEPSGDGVPQHAAAILPLRMSSSGKGVECLFAQSEVLNMAISTSADSLVPQQWPGELRFIGGSKVFGHMEPLQTLQAALDVLDIPVSLSAEPVWLFDKTVFQVKSRKFEVFVCIIWADGESYWEWLAAQPRVEEATESLTASPFPRNMSFSNQGLPHLASQSHLDSAIQPSVL